MPSVERRSFVNGLFKELSEQLLHYHDVLGEMFELQARVEVNERSLKATRDHLLAVLSEAGEETPENWDKVLHQVRFLGMRLADACLEVLKERGNLTVDELRDELDHGMFRFRTPSPLREMNAALLRHPNIRREDDRYVYEPPEVKLKAVRKESA